MFCPPEIFVYHFLLEYEESIAIVTINRLIKLGIDFNKSDKDIFTIEFGI